jgi:hypothetical protein
VNWVDSLGLDVHHIIPVSIWENLNLSGDVRYFLRHAVVEAGSHNFSTPHPEYNALVRNLWNDFFKGVKPEQITKAMAEDFMRRVESHPEVSKKLIEILEKGAARSISRWAKVGRFCGKAGKVLPVVGTILFLWGELGDVAEAY